MALVNTYMYGATMTEKLSKDAWLSFALNHLSNHGHTKLSANWMAAKLGVSRGSFYWHFANVQEFKTLLLKRWAALTTDEVIKDLSELESSDARLSALVERSMKADTKLERAVRSWATTDNQVASYVRSVDIRRVHYVENILTDMGVRKVDIKPRAQMLYWAGIGRMMSVHNADTTLTDSDYNRFVHLLTT